MNKTEILALKPGAELDDLVAGEVMRWKPHFRNTALYVKDNEHDKVISKVERAISDWKPSTSISDAWTVVGHLMNHDYAFTISPGIGVICFGPNGDHSIEMTVVSETPEAICKAALLAVQEEK